MRHFTKAAAVLAVVAAGSASSALAVETDTSQIRAVRNVFNADVSRTGTAICYSSLGQFNGFGFTGAGGSFIYADDIIMNKPAGTRIDSITFSVVSFNTDGSYAGGGTGGTVTANLTVGLFNADPVTGLPDFGAAKALIPVNGIQIEAFTGALVTINVKDLNIIKKDERMWAAIVYNSVTGPANADLSPLISNVGQLIAGAGPAEKGFSEDFFFSGETGGLLFFGGFPAGFLYANFMWEFNSIPTPGAMAIFGLAGLAATRRRR